MSQQEGQQFAHMNGMEFVETSAKEDFNVKFAFSRTTLAILRKVNSGEIMVDSMVKDL